MNKYGHCVFGLCIIVKCTRLYFDAEADPLTTLVACVLSKYEHVCLCIWAYLPRSHRARTPGTFWYDAALQHLKAYESPASLGALTLRFYAAGADRILANDFIISFANLRGQPRYKAVYLQGVADDPFRVEDCPFFVTDMVEEETAVHQIGPAEGSRLMSI